MMRVVLLVLACLLVSCSSTPTLQDVAVNSVNAAKGEGLAAHTTIDTTCARVYATRGVAEGDRICGPAVAAYERFVEGHAAAVACNACAGETARLALAGAELARAVADLMREVGK